MSNAIELVTLVVPDESSRVLLLHRRDHSQWQLPGGRMLFGESPDQAAGRHAMEELNIDVKLQRYLGHTTFTQRDTHYTSEWRKAISWQNDPIVGDMDVYDAAEYFNLFLKNIHDIGMSPNVQNLISAMYKAKIDLLND
jgi:ADP-ribose pyrophosphatase YjhB (NUDIX family)